MKIGKSPLAGLALAGALAGMLVFAPSAHATSFNVVSSFYTGGDDNFQGFDQANIAAQPAGNSSIVLGNVAAGGILLQQGQTSLEAFCVDLSHYVYVPSTVNYNVLSQGSATVTGYFSSLYTGANGAQTVTRLDELATNALPLVNNADSSAAFQLAIWDIIYGAPGSGFSIAASGSHNATVNADVTTFLALANSNNPITEQLSFLQDSGTNGGAIQNLITFSPTPVPVPGAVWLMISGLGGLGAIARKRKVA